MKWFRQFIQWFTNWWYSEQDTIITEYELESVVDLPMEKSLVPNIVYHIGDEDWKWLIQLKCPCGCQEVIQLSLLERSQQFWRLEKHDEKRFSIYPSIHRTTGCKSHFWMRDNYVEWCKQ